MLSDEEKLERKRAQKRAYYHANKEKRRAYLDSEAGKAAVKRYEQSEKGRAAAKRKSKKNKALAHNRLKVRARETLKKAIKAGRVERGLCHCGKIGEAHHEDYSKRLDVIWLCSEHHREHHFQVRDGALKTYN